MGKLKLNPGINSWQRQGAALSTQNSAMLHSTALVDTQFIEAKLSLLNEHLPLK